MSNILFTDSEVKKLRKNKYVKNVSNKSITYTDEFKEKVVFETENYKKFSRQVFEECNLVAQKYGLVLSNYQIMNLLEKRKEALKNTRYILRI